ICSCPPATPRWRWTSESPPIASGCPFSALSALRQKGSLRGRFSIRPPFRFITKFAIDDLHHLRCRNFGGRRDPEQTEQRKPFLPLFDGIEKGTVQPGMLRRPVGVEVIRSSQFCQSSTNGSIEASLIDMNVRVPQKPFVPA